MLQHVKPLPWFVPVNVLSWQKQDVRVLDQTLPTDLVTVTTFSAADLPSRCAARLQSLGQIPSSLLLEDAEG